jgi:hypothetical protein
LQYNDYEEYITIIGEKIYARKFEKIIPRNKKALKKWDKLEITLYRWLATFDELTV